MCIYTHAYIHTQHKHKHRLIHTQYTCSHAHTNTLAHMYAHRNTSKTARTFIFCLAIAADCCMEDTTSTVVRCPSIMFFCSTTRMIMLSTFSISPSSIFFFFRHCDASVCVCYVHVHVCTCMLACGHESVSRSACVHVCMCVRVCMCVCFRVRVHVACALGRVCFQLSNFQRPRCWRSRDQLLQVA